MFILDSSRTKLTMAWLDRDATAVDLPVVGYSPDVVTATEYRLLYFKGSTMYSFYPKLGVMFMSVQYLEVDGQLARQSAMFAKCEFSWSGKP
jgi:hypothetical protein